MLNPFSKKEKWNGLAMLLVLRYKVQTENLFITSATTPFLEFARSLDNLESSGSSTATQFNLYWHPYPGTEKPEFVQFSVKCILGHDIDFLLLRKAAKSSHVRIIVPPDAREYGWEEEYSMRIFCPKCGYTFDLLAALTQSPESKFGKWRTGIALPDI